MRAITVRQPWAWAIIHGGKNVENRSRNIAGTYRGPVAIHAGLAWDDFAVAQGDAGHTLAWALMREGKRKFVATEQGVILGVVDLVDVHDADDCHQASIHKAIRLYRTDRPAFDALPDRNSAGGAIRKAGLCSRWAIDEHHHLVLANPRPLAEHVPAKGRLGLWTLPDDVEAAIARQVTP